MTLREIGTEVRASAQDDAEMFRLAQVTGWFAEAYARTKKLPDLEKIMNPSSTLSPEDRAERQASLLRRLAAVSGGQLVEVQH